MLLAHRVVGYWTTVMPSYESIPKTTLNAKIILGQIGLWTSR